MAQVYLSKFIAITRDDSAAVFKGFKSGGDIITEQNTAASMQDLIKIESSDGNQQIFNEMKLIADATNFVAYDESGPAPTTGDLTYNNNFIALIIEQGATQEDVYLAGGDDIPARSDKLTFLAELRQIFGDGKFRIFQETVQIHTHAFVLVP